MIPVVIKIDCAVILEVVKSLKINTVTRADECTRSDTGKNR